MTYFHQVRNNKIENKKKKQRKLIKPNAAPFKKINKIDKPLARLIDQQVKRELTNYQNYE